MPRALDRARGYVRTRVAEPTALVTPPLCATASLVALRLAERYELLGDVVRCNTGDEQASPDYNHAYLLVYAQGRPTVGS
jgi:hypothetical protein